MKSFDVIAKINQTMSDELVGCLAFLKTKHSNLHKFGFYKTSNQCFSMYLKYQAVFDEIERPQGSLNSECIRLLQLCKVILEKNHIMTGKAMKCLKLWTELGHLSNYCSFLICTISRLHNLSSEAKSYIEKTLAESNVSITEDIKDKRIFKGEFYIPSKRLKQHTSNFNDEHISADHDSTEVGNDSTAVKKDLKKKVRKVKREAIECEETDLGEEVDESMLCL